jgi:two-component system chemotaxis sensor kinase CheA
MDNSMQNMLDMYLFETNSLIEQLDGILLDSEQADSFSEDDINAIFRIMHTIKGSSAMMQFDSLMTAAHRIEDLFFYIRENGMNHEHSRELFNMLFTASDFMKAEIEKIENDEPLTEDISGITGHIQQVLDLISGKPSEAAGEGGDEAAGGAGSAAEEVLDENHPYGIRVHFDEGLGMENLRAFMVANSIGEAVEDFTVYPPDVETDSSTSAYIVENGVVFGFKNEEEQKTGVALISEAVNIKSFEELRQNQSLQHRKLLRKRKNRLRLRKLLLLQQHLHLQQRQRMIRKHLPKKQPERKATQISRVLSASTFQSWILLWI